MTIELKHLPLDCLTSGTYQPRQNFNPSSLQELAQSIKTHGLLEPLIIQPISNQQYEIIAGERRWRAAKLAGLTTVPCLIGAYSNQQAAAIALIENIQRENLNPIEEALGYRRLIDEFNFQQTDVATLIGKSRTHVTNALRVLSLCPEVKNMLSKNVLSIGHAKIMVGLNPYQQIAIAEQTIQKNWSVRQLEDYLRKQKKSHQPSQKQPSKTAGYLEQQISEHLGAPVEISRDADKGGWLKIRFYDNDTLSGILSRFGLTEEY